MNTPKTADDNASVVILKRAVGNGLLPVDAIRKYAVEAGSLSLQGEVCHITGYSRPLFSTDIDVSDRMIYILVDDLNNIISEFDIFDYVRQYDNIFQKTKIIEDCIKLPLYIEFESKNEFIKWKLKR